MTNAAPIRVRDVAMLVVCALVTAACLPEPATRQGRSISALYEAVLILALVVMTVVWGLITVAIVRYRRRGRGATDSLPPQIGGHVGLEALWTIVPLLMIFGIFGGTLFTLNEVERRESASPVELHVEAFRWGWRMTYPTEGVEVSGFLDPGPQAVVPAGQPLLINLTSVDVIHSFYVPQFLYKRDAVPGVTHEFELTIEEEGTFIGQCAEFCGLFHARMPFSIRSVPQAEYEAWLAEQQAASQSAAASPPAATPGQVSPSP